jgi:hypothetical protein
MHKEHTFFEKATRKPIALCCGPTFRERKGLPVAVNETGCAHSADGRRTADRAEEGGWTSISASAGL